MYEPTDARYTPETMHEGTMRDQVLQRMLQGQPATGADGGGPVGASTGAMPPQERAVREARVERRDEQRMVESTVAEREASGQDFGSLLFGLGSQGIDLMVEMQDRQLVGKIVHVGSDLIVVESIGGERYDVAVSAITGLRATRGEARPGAVSTGHPNTVTARLREALATGEAVSISRQFGNPMGGTLQGVSEGHVQGVDHNGSYWFLPIGMVTWVTAI